ncbi:hypothetical protein EQU24_15140 [Methylotuvimicrobium buryatense]|uniref:Uncharacterized protein n=1 Tax=Methylotuvimicrobium buryatense TaxID=95641 RepID=A0A4P9UUR9_METBY|nr:hypothetical protein EQU24_15140 [Methylotuvimicrobium buryatense]
MDLNQFILYPIHGKIALYWFLGGLVEFSIYGAFIPGFSDFPVRFVEVWVDEITRNHRVGHS